jgi:hypothetical protein
LKPRPQGIAKSVTVVTDDALMPQGGETRFEIRHRSGVKAFAVEEDAEFIVLAGSQALKDTD